MSDNHYAEFKYRIGTFFILMGFFAFLLLILTYMAGNPQYNYFFVGVFLFLMGFLFQRNGPKPPPNNRFQFLRAMREKSKQRKEEKKKKQEKK